VTLYERIFRVSPGGCFLALGAWEDVVVSMAKAGWKGAWIQGSKATWPKWDWTWDVWKIQGELGADPHFVQTLDGHMVRAFTIQEVFNQYPGPYSAVLIDWPMMTRRLFHSPQIQLGRARVIVLPEDGHNEAVRKVAAENGYRFDDSMPDYCFMNW
jgi:hypothetical protein